MGSFKIVRTPLFQVVQILAKPSELKYHNTDPYNVQQCVLKKNYSKCEIEDDQSLP